jgi:hypothetical protein
MPLAGVEFEIACALAAPLPSWQRENFMRAIEDALRAWPEAARGPGLVHRLGADLQRKFFDAPVRVSRPQHSRKRSPEAFIHHGRER